MVMNMCKVGDIILINNCKRNNREIGKHSFVVLSTADGQIAGLEFNLVCNLMSSFEGKGSDYKKKKLSYPENMPYEPLEENIILGNANNKDGFIKAGVYFYFKKEDLDYVVIGNVLDELLNRLFEYIRNMSPNEIKHVIDNLSS